MIFIFLRESCNSGIIVSCPQVVLLGYRVELLTGVLVAVWDLFCFFYGVSEGVVGVAILYVAFCICDEDGTSLFVAGVVVPGFLWFGFPCPGKELDKMLDSFLEKLPNL